MKGRDDGGPQRDAMFEGEFGAAMRELQLTRFGEPEDIANLAAFLASRDAEFLTGMILPADGGATAKLPIPPASVLTRLFAQSGS